MWLHDLLGVSDDFFESLHDNLRLNGTTLTSKINGSSFECGTVEIVSLNVLNKRVSELDLKAGAITIDEVILDSKELH